MKIFITKVLSNFSQCMTSFKDNLSFKNLVKVYYHSPSARPRECESVVCGVLRSVDAYPHPDDPLSAHCDDPASDYGNSSEEERKKGRN